MKRAGLIALILVLAIAGGAFALRGPLALAVTDRALQKTMAADTVRDLPDGLHAYVCGSGSPLPDRDRAGPCLAVIAGQRLFIVDAGEGAAETLTFGNVPAGRIEQVFLTHFHSDHMDGLGNLALQRWVGASARTPLPLAGPPGVERVAEGFNAAYAQDFTYRTAHHGEQYVPAGGAGYAARPFAFPEGQDSVVVLENGGLKVTAFKVDHSPVEPAVGYRFEYKGRVLVVSGDTAPSQSLAVHAKGADLLVMEALSPQLVRRLQDAATKAGQTTRAKVLADIPDYHASPLAAAQLAERCGAKSLLLTHIVPPLPMKPLEAVFLGDARKAFAGPLWIARDRDLISLPAGSTAIERKRIGR